MKVGDKVKLKSGGPLMTIAELFENNLSQIYCKCVWFDESNKVESHIFPIDSLEITM